MTKERKKEFYFSKHFSGPSASTDAGEFMFEKIAEAKRNVRSGEKLIYLDHHSIPLEKGKEKDKYEVLLVMQIVPKGPEDEEDEED